MTHPSSITYDEFGFVYDDSHSLYDGGATVRPIYWRGFGGSGDKIRQKAQALFTSIVIESAIVSVNGYRVEFTESEAPSIIKFAGIDDDEVAVSVGSSLKISTLDDPYEVESNLITEAELVLSCLLLAKN